MMMSRTFQRQQEDFVCEHCGAMVHGDGYTNHCPHCLYSKHVDVFPGDRAESCGGLMVTLLYEVQGSRGRLMQRCVRCGIMRNNKVQKEDDFEALLAVQRKRAANFI